MKNKAIKEYIKDSPQNEEQHPHTASSLGCGKQSERQNGEIENNSNNESYAANEIRDQKDNYFMSILKRQW